MFQYLKHLIVEEYDDYRLTILARFKNGKIVESDEKRVIEWAQSLGFVKTGTHEIEEIDENGLTRRLRFVITAKCTKLGIETLRYMKL